MKEARFVTFTRWCINEKDRVPVTVNPAEVSDVLDYCGDIEPGSQITLKNKKTYLVRGVHADIVAKLKGDDKLRWALTNLVEYVEAGADGVNGDIWIEQAREALK